MKYLTLILLFIYSCQKENNVSLNEVYSDIYQKWLMITQVEYKTHNGLINSPKGIELYLGKLKTSSGLKKSSNYCLYFRTPIKNKTGIFTIVEGDTFYECPLTSSGNIIYQIDQISEFNFLPTTYDLNFEFKYNQENIKWSFPFHNLKLGSVHEKYKAEKELKKLNGFSILPFDDELKNQSSGKGNKADRFSLKNAIKCKTVSANCETVGEDFCNLCSFGSYEVVDYACPNGGSRFCGINHCGEKNEPACLRGTLNKDAEIDGICNVGLVPTLNAEHILVCQ